MEVEVITPVGPGHEGLAVEALASAMHLGFDVIPIDDTEGKLGRSKARNIGVRLATAEWVFFLDADDLMHEDAKKAKKFTKYDGIWGLINDGKVRVPQVRSVDFNTLLGHEPTQTLQMGHFIRREVALDYPFDESLDCGEDFDYYLRVWRDKNCIKIPHTLFVNRRGMHSTGPRSADGRMWREQVEKLQVQYRSKGKLKKVGNMYLPESDQMFVRSFQRGEVFDGLSLQTAMKYCKNMRTAIDGGAHVGSWSRELSNRFNRVVAFEPSDDNHKCLVKNAPGAEIHKKALGEKRKKVSIEITDPRNTGQNHVAEGDDIEMVPIDDYHLEDVDFIKLDVEGYELYALQGAEETMKRCSPVVLIEVNGLAERYGLHDSDACNYLRGLGYKLKDRVNKDMIYVR